MVKNFVTKSYAIASTIKFSSSVELDVCFVDAHHRLICPCWCTSLGRNGIKRPTAWFLASWNFSSTSLVVPSKALKPEWPCQNLHGNRCTHVIWFTSLRTKKVGCLEKLPQG